MGILQKKDVREQFLWAIVIGFVGAILSLTISSFSLFNVWELKAYDLRMGLVREGKRRPQHVVQFFVDEDSLRYMEKQGVGWPWPRELYASALDFCRKGGAKAVLFDLYYSEDSSYGVDDDLAFALGVEKGPPSYFILFLSDNVGKDDPRDEIVFAKSAVEFELPVPLWVEHQRSLQSIPIAPLVAVAKGFGNAQFSPDVDGVYRRIPLVQDLNDTSIPSISLKLVVDVLGSPGLAWPDKRRFILGDRNVPLDNDGRMMINYYGGPDTFPTYSLAEILVSDAAITQGRIPSIDPSVVKDKVVIIGVAAPGLYDLKPTPLAHVYPGPEVHATAIENLLTSDFITPVDTFIAAVVAIVCSIIVALGFAIIASPMGMGIWLISVALSVVGTNIVLFRYNIWMPLVPISGAMALSSFGMIARNYLTEGRKKREIRRAFGQYLSPHVVSEIARDPEALKLGGTMQEVTLLFSDIADFTTMSEKISPTELVSRLNDYFTKTTRIIQATGGTLDKYIGDAIMAFWGAPLSYEDHTIRAIRAALEIQAVLASSGTFITRIGIHSGKAVVGNIGSDVRFNYTAIGDTVNLASRLEGLNKKFGTRIIISESSWCAASSVIEARRIGKVRVKGRLEEVGIYEPLGFKGSFGTITAQVVEEFEKALEFFEMAKFRDARSLFSEISSKYGDRASAFYEKLCIECEGKESPNFDGVITFTAK